MNIHYIFRIFFGLGLQKKIFIFTKSPLYLIGILAR